MGNPRSKHGWYRRSTRNLTGSHALSGLRRRCKRKLCCCRREHAGSGMPSPDGAACKACASMVFSTGCGKIAQAPCALSSLGGNPPGSSSTESDLKGIGCSMFSPAWLTLPTASRCIRIKVPKCELREQKEKENRKARRARKDGAKAKAEGRARAKAPQTPTPLWIREINEAYLFASCSGGLVVGLPPRCGNPNNGLGLPSKSDSAGDPCGARPRVGERAVSYERRAHSRADEGRPLLCLPYGSHPPAMF